MKKASKKQLEALVPATKATQNEHKRIGSSFFALKRIVVKHVENEEHVIKETEDKKSESSQTAVLDTSTDLEVNLNNKDNK